MNKKLMLMGLLLLPVLISAQSQDIKLGGIDFPRAYIHAGKEFPQGRYEVVLTVKDAVPFFNVYNSNQELLFEEMAIVIEHTGGKRTFAYRLKKGFLKDGEYFRIMVSKPGQSLLGCFLVKK